MNHVIVGTAGHIDHGKTALIRALTGIECDTHREEKRRGITINLGFAHLQLTDDTTVGVVDVPGHRDFIHTMVAGASGIDVALLVVAADGGVMPQTREHMAIMDMLGVRHGLIALTRTDLVDDGMAALAVEEIGAFVKGTFLEGCPVLPVSSRTGAGIDALRAALASVVASVNDRSRSDLFRMYIDRIFSVSGFGTVVTGSVLGGNVNTGSRLFVLPGGKEVRIRRMERYGNEVDSICGGDRASVNLVGLSRDEFVRGMLLADRRLRDTTLLDARIRLFDQTPPVGLWSQVQFYVGTFDAQVRMHLIDADTVQPGDEAVVQLHLPQPCVAQAGDRFILRSTSNDRTIGGGTVIDAAPLHHRRRPEQLVKKLQVIAQGNRSELIAAEIRKHPGGITINRLSTILNCSENDVTTVASALPDDVVSLTGGRVTGFISREGYERLREKIIQTIADFHRSNPLEAAGRTPEELLGMIGLEQGGDSASVLQLVLDRLAGENMLKKVRHTWALAGHTVDVSQGYGEGVAVIEKVLSSFGLRTPPETELRETARREGVDDHMLRQILSYLQKENRVYHVEGAWMHASVVDPVRKTLLTALAGNPEGLTVAQFRDLIDGNRKICLLLYALFDREGITDRNGDVRRITAEGKRLLKSLAG